jgi:two-component system OmpR family sensor kinase
LYYPNSSEYKSAIYDKNKNYIFGTLNAPLQENLADGYITHIEKVEPYYLGAAYLMLRSKVDYSPIIELKKRVLLFMLLALVVFGVLGYFLGRLFIKPMRDSIERLNSFIQDTTHELNTPISTILTNIELIETFDTNYQNKDELKRITIASKTLSRIYDDLSYLSLNHNYHRDIQRIDISALLFQRVEYVQAMANLKNITITTDIEQNIHIDIDKNDATRMIDNLLSNAIKYNKTGGDIKVSLQNKTLTIQDSGIGIAKDKLHIIKARFQRANSTEGGFGIGLDIVNQIVEFYGYGMSIESIEKIGTTIKVRLK